MSREKRKFDASIKAKVAIEALKEQKTASEIAAIYEISPMQVSTWKKEFLENSSKVFENKKADRLAKKQEEQLDVLYKKVGILEIERDFLKKNLEKLGK
jgi:transposase